MAKKYVIAAGGAIVTRGVIFKDGDEVEKSDFATEEVFGALIKGKKIVEAGEAAEKKADADAGKDGGKDGVKDGDDPNKKDAGKGAGAPQK